MNLEKIISEMKRKQKTQKIFDSMDEPESYQYLTNTTFKEDYLANLNIGIKVFEKTAEYNAFVKVYIKESIFDIILKEMALKKENPITFDAAIENNRLIVEFLKNKPKHVIFNNKKLYIDYKAGGGFGMGEYSSEAKVFVLSNNI